jgi:AcrR family transcriptional regulator
VDAEQNRERILAAARTALAENGDATMQSIAKRAGIGQGTLYRHFPTREALVMTVHRSDVRDLVAAAPDLLTEHPSDVALRLWFGQLAQYGRIKRGLLGALHTVMHAELASEGYEPVIGAIRLLLEAGVRDGSVRSDVEPEEVLLLVGFLWRIDLDADREARAAHMLDVVVDGLRPPR